MARLTVLLATILIIAMGGSAGSAAAADEDEGAAPTGSAEALLAALARVPDSPAARGSTISYLDQKAATRARPGAAQPESMAELEALLGSDDLSASLWLAAMQGASSGDLDILQGFGSADRWPGELGFDLLDIDQHLTFGEPPSDGSVLLGGFDPPSIVAAFTERGYTASPAGARTSLCGAVGCEEGQRVDISKADRGLPFGAALGRSEPLVVSERDILSSADLGTLTAMVAAADDDVPAMADDPSYHAIAVAVDPTVTLIQATLLPGGMLDVGPEIYGLLSDSPEEAGRLVVEPDELFEPMPAPGLLGILDGATETEQVVILALAYTDEADAAVATEVLPRRLETLPTLSAGALSELLAERGVTSVVGRVVPPGDETAPLAVVELRAPLASPEPTADGGRPASSSHLYRLFVDLAFRRDLLWLVPVLPLE